MTLPELLKECRTGSITAQKYLYDQHVTPRFLILYASVKQHCWYRITSSNQLEYCNWIVRKGIPPSLNKDQTRYWQTFYAMHDVARRKRINLYLTTQRKDFIAFKYNEVRQRPNNFPTVNLNFSAGYLIGRRGNWFEPNSFKFAVPGFAMRNMTLESEFHFNKLFENFSPSLRLTLDIE